MGPVMWRPRTYYVKLLAIWAAFGVCLYMYHFHIWYPVEQAQQTLFVRRAERPKPETAQQRLYPMSMAIDSASSESSYTSTTPPFSSSSTEAVTHASSWIRRNTNKETAIGKLSSKEGKGDVMGDYDDDDDDDDDNDTDDEGDNDVSHDTANFNPRLRVHDAFQAESWPVGGKISAGKGAEVPESVDLNAKSPLKWAPAEADFGAVKKKTEMLNENIPGPFLPNKDIFTRDISDLTQRELIYRFVHNKQEVLRRSESTLPMYLKQRNLHWTLKYAGEYPSTMYSPPPNELPDQRLPQAIIIGAGKCGTRALLEFLSMHPLAVTPDPEIHYFDLDSNFVKGLDWYRSQMPIAYTNQMTIEKTPSYIWSERAVHEIYRMNKTIKLIAILRDPVDRIVSQASRYQGENGTVERFFLGFENGHYRIKTESHTVDWGIYIKYIKAWRSRFPSTQLHILESKELIKNPALEIQKIERFLGLPPMITAANFYYNSTKGFFCMRPFYPRVIKCLPQAKGKKHLEIKPVHQKMLYDFYRPYNDELFALLGRRFNWVPKQ